MYVTFFLIQYAWVHTKEIYASFNESQRCSLACCLQYIGMTMCDMLLCLPILKRTQPGMRLNAIRGISNKDESNLETVLDSRIPSNNNKVTQGSNSIPA